MVKFFNKSNTISHWWGYLLCALVLVSSAEAAAPTRQTSYTTNEVISSSDVTSNENEIFTYLQNGVDVYADGSIVNADISSAAAIQSDKLTLSSIGQPITMSANIINNAKGADVASATTVTLGNDGNYFDITGTTTITSITAKTAGTLIILQFDGILTLTDGSNLIMAGNFVTTANDTIMMVSDGTNWHEVARSVN